MKQMVKKMIIQVIFNNDTNYVNWKILEGRKIIFVSSALIHCIFVNLPNNFQSQVEF